MRVRRRVGGKEIRMGWVAGREDWEIANDGSKMGEGWETGRRVGMQGWRI